MAGEAPPSPRSASERSRTPARPQSSVSAPRPRSAAVQHDPVHRSAAMSIELLEGASREASRPPELPVLVVDGVAEERRQTIATLVASGLRATGEPGGDAALRHVRSQLVRLVIS